MMRTTHVEGFVASGYESVLEKFESLIERGLISRGQLCVYIQNEIVLDLCAKREDVSSEEYSHDSLSILFRLMNSCVRKRNDSNRVLVFSSSKVINAIALALLIEQGQVEYEDKVMTHWPEFGSMDGKEDIHIADIMRHEAGLSRMKSCYDIKLFTPEEIKKGFIGREFENLDLDDEAREHDGTQRRQYHFFTQGYLTNEICYRTDKHQRTIGELWRDKTRELGIEVSIGLEPTDNERIKRLVKLDFPSPFKLIRNLVWDNDPSMPTIASITGTLPVFIKGRLKSNFIKKYTI